MKKLPHPVVLLGAYALAATCALVLRGIGYRFEPTTLRLLVFPLAGGLAAWTVRRAEARTASPILLLATGVGTIELLGNTASIPEALSFAWEAAAPADLGLAGYLAGAVCGLVAGACALAAAECLAARMPRSERRVLGRVVAPVAVLQAVVFLMIAGFGLGSLGTRAFQAFLLLTQLPAITLLRQMGWCCGVSGGLVLTDVIDPHWGGLTAIGIPILFIVNTTAVAAVLMLGRSAWTLLLEHRGARARPPVSVPAPTLGGSGL
jgi:hypothetical protein